MRSADLRARIGAAGAAALLAAALSGCVSTQTKNARTLLVNQRTLDSESAVRVTRATPEVSVSRVQMVRSGNGIAAVVTVHNLTRHPLSDLPISIAVRRGRHIGFLNAGANLPYFETHIAGLPATASAIWVLMLRRPPSVRGGALIAIVGAATKPASTRDESLPRLHVSAIAARSGQLGVSVANPSEVPQYDVPVYAVANRDGQYVAAAAGSIAELDGGERTTLRLKLFGTTTAATLDVSAPPTIFN